MKKEQFLRQASKFDLIDETVLAHLARQDAGFYNQISKWVKDGTLTRLTKGRYVIAVPEFTSPISLFGLSHLINKDSYISLHSVLAKYRLIPEVNFDQVIYSVTSTKTRSFKTKLGVFYYSHVKPSIFTGYQKRQDEHSKIYYEATPTKALLDYLYLSADDVVPNIDYFEQGLRLQNLHLLSRKEVRMYKEVYSTKMAWWIDVLLNYLKQG